MSAGNGNGHAWVSTTARWSCPEGNVYVTIARTPEGQLRRVWVTVGKAGTALYAAGDALGAVARLALDSGVPLDQLVRYLRGISHADYNRLAHEAMSMSDALGRTLEWEVSAT